MSSRVINSTADRIVIIKGGKRVYNRDPSKDPDLNTAAKIAVQYVLTQTMEGSGGWSDGLLSRLGWQFGSKKYDINEFVITSMFRPGENSVHGQDLAVDFYVYPLYLNIPIFNDLAKIGTGSKTFIGCNLWTDAQRAQTGRSAALHVHYDTSSAKGSKNLKSVEYEQTPLDGSCAQINPTVADKILDQYGVPSKFRDTFKNDLMNMTSGGGVSMPDSPPEPFVPSGSDLNDTIKKVLGFAALGLLIYGGYRFVKAGGVDSLVEKQGKSKKKKVLTT
jgi:hypothetical protein